MVTRRLSSALLALGADAAHLLRQRPPCDSMRRCSRHSFATRAAWREGEPAPRAAAVVIGNEVLSGKIQDTNSAWLGAKMAHRGPQTFFHRTSTLRTGCVVMFEVQDVCSSLHRGKGALCFKDALNLLVM